MSPTLHVSLTAGMLLFSVTGLCCALVGDRRRDHGNQRMRPPTLRGLCVSLGGAVWMAVMLLAMVDISTASITLLSEAAWALSLLLACPVSVGTALRGHAFVAMDSLSISMTLHRGLSLLVMGVLIVLVHPETKPPITAVSDVHHHGVVTATTPFMLIGLVAYLLFTIWNTWGLHQAPLSRNGRRSHLLETISSGAAVACMTAMIV
jgi:hypothetical protein